MAIPPRASEFAVRLGIPFDIASVDADASQLVTDHADAVRGGHIVTPDLRRCGVAGVMRQVLLEQRPGIDLPVEIRDVALEELDDAEECFLTNAVIGVWPVAHILDRVPSRLRPGRIARSIIGALEARFGFPRSQ